MCGGLHCVILENEQGTWRTLAQGAPRKPAEPPPPELLTTVADQEALVQSGGWLALPLAPRESTEILAFQGNGTWSPALVTQLTRFLQSARSLVRARRQSEFWRRFHNVLDGEPSTQDPEAPPASSMRLHRILDLAREYWQAERVEYFVTSDRTHAQPASGGKHAAWQGEVLAQVVAEATSKQHHATRATTGCPLPVVRKAGPATAFMAVPVASERGMLVGFLLVERESANPFRDSEASEGLHLVANLTNYLRRVSQSFVPATETRHLPTGMAAQPALLGDHPRIKAVRDRARRIAATDLSVLVTGENGTGKEIMSRWIHDLSPRREGPFLAINCAAITESLLESELFGHEKGAYTDAHQARPGKFELARNGTLFLDEVGELSLRAQAKLLRVLEERCVTRVGAESATPVNTRLIAATHRDLAQLVRDKAFREDLFFRLHVVAIDLPPLRDRGDDVLALIDHFLHVAADRANAIPPRLTPEAIRALQNYPWPGNVRELRNLVERIVVLHAGTEVTQPMLQLQEIQGSETFSIDAGAELAEATRRFQATLIEKQIQACKGNMTEAAARLGLHRTNLYRKMRQLGIHSAAEYMMEPAAATPTTSDQTRQ